MSRKRIAVLTGAGVSAESGFATFRDSGGLWEKYDVQDVASIEGWYRNRSLVLDFYNDRRRQLKDAKPNSAHYAIAELEKDFDVDVIQFFPTQWYEPRILESCGTGHFCNNCIKGVVLTEMTYTPTQLAVLVQ